MKYIDQIKDLNLETITTTKTYLYWKNCEDGRDLEERYERRIIGNKICWFNNYCGCRLNTTITSGDEFFETLEEMYKIALGNAKEKRILLTDSIINQYGKITGSECWIWTTDYSFKFSVKRVDNTKFAVRIHRNNNKMFLRYVSYLDELEAVYEVITDKKLKLN